MTQIADAWAAALNSKRAGKMSGLVKPPECATDDADMREAMRETRDMVERAHFSVPPESLPQWVLYRPDPADPYGLYVGRLWLALPAVEDTGVTVRAGDLAMLRDMLPPGLARLARMHDDDPTILEVWI